MRITSLICAAVLAASSLALSAPAGAQGSEHIRTITFANAPGTPVIYFDLRDPPRYLEDGTLLVNCVPPSSNPTGCFPRWDSRTPEVALTSNLPWVAGTNQTVYLATSGSAFPVFRQITGTAEVCFPFFEGEATVENWSSVSVFSGTSSVRISVNVPPGQTRDITLALACFNQFGGRGAVRRTFRVFRP